MKKLFPIFAIICLATMLITSCGAGVDRSDPKAVADAALQCYDKGDYTTLKTLINPSDQYKLDEMDKIIERSEKWSEEHGEEDIVLKQRTFKSAEEQFTGKEITSQSSGAVVYYDGDWPMRVILTQVDGKWYFEQFK